MEGHECKHCNAHIRQVGSMWLDFGPVFPQYCQSPRASEQMHEPLVPSRWEQLAAMHGKAVSYGYHRAFGHADVHLFDDGQLWLVNGDVVQIPVNRVLDVYFDDGNGVWQVFIT